MGKKLRLSLERLEVESFSVRTEEKAQGTVAAFATRRDYDTCDGPTCIHVKSHKLRIEYVRHAHPGAQAKDVRVPMFERSRVRALARKPELQCVAS